MASSVLNGIGLAGYWLIGYRGIHEKGSGDVVSFVYLYLFFSSS